MGSDSRSGDPLLDALRRVRPARVVLILGDGTERALALRTGATRYQHAAATARAMAGDDDDARVELRDSEGLVLAAVPLEDATEESSSSSSSAPVLAAPDARDERMLTLLVSAQRAALEEQRMLLAPVLEAYTNLARGYADYAAQVVELVRVASTVRAELQESQASPADAALSSVLAQLGSRPAPNGAPRG